MRLQLTKPQNAAFILIALCLCACKSRQKVTQLQSLNKINASQIVESTLFHTIDFVLVDSTVEYSGADTTTRVRHVRASTQARETNSVASNFTAIDTAAAVQTQTEVTPIAAESKKKGEAWLCPRVRMADIVIFLVLLIIFVVSLKKCLLLRHK